MAEEISQFASEQVELSELERIQQRLNTFTVGLKPANAEVVNQVMQKGLSSGNFQLNDLDALVSVREDVAKGLIDWNTTVNVANKRIQELQAEELQAARDLVAKNLYLQIILSCKLLLVANSLQLLSTDVIRKVSEGHKRSRLS